ncbi:photosynthetic NDH subunit of lumenal location 4, chloroplastic [Gastrolobium bilobum]|uniref:photosynthetic NDH subunit of lumenal location 4, chloroplastic n=1 Tax=Gastrolobium bilobum TaxID=150636 RepID=UPI002AB08FAD|nr:photosynthetic NDH subunit of lumenal location 4, chloroplastic [Gastrolobium bilobum]XP_061345313.1 photosynthetic NDH subunit of lumenal location 4, chloroplastic [Gastrolobium bilobum]XP_061345319.1 photosynthetic NDH subunit of lumenal location 4, chloroplastic [Gastrolobium bilobum]XP_061345326.1 photosynthetic NDH subunit of lumenal location 4, chloroplastic [Gastrolobium bilobum]XP_061345332.1 photosynthetic NDH subunit of lumenal location 4, chloroplastic [Gastrolobium bilobum]XP_06
MARSLSLSLSLSYGVGVVPSCLWKPKGMSCKAPNKVSCSAHAHSDKNPFVGIGIGVVAASVMGLTPLDADATRIEYYATVGEPLCELNYAKSGLGYCDIVEGVGDEAPLGELINVHYTARFADGTVFDSSYKRARPLTMRIGAGKVIKGLDQGILGGEGVPPMRIGGKRKLRIPPLLAYGPEPAGCFSGDCNIPGNATLLYDINFIGIYSGNRK